MRGIRSALASWVVASLAGGASAQEPPAHVLLPEARELRLNHGGRRVDGAAVEKRLHPSVRLALNAWAPLAGRHDLHVAVPAEAHALLVGAVDDADRLEHAADVLDRTWELFAGLLASDDGSDEAVTCFLFDRDGFRSEAWGGLLDELVARNALVPDGAAFLRDEPGGLTNREQGLFVQPVDDLAGDAAAGDDEFRLDNELAHKLAACLLRRRFGEQPEILRWGLGYVAEQRLFRSIYQFDRVGFVAAADHFDWPDRAADALEEALEDDGFRLSACFLAPEDAGRATPRQMIAWGVLDYLVHEGEPEALATLLSDLGALHAEGARHALTPLYAGDPGETAARLDEALAGLEPKSLLKHLARVK